MVMKKCDTMFFLRKPCCQECHSVPSDDLSVAVIVLANRQRSGAIQQPWVSLDQQQESGGGPVGLLTMKWGCQSSAHLRQMCLHSKACRLLPPVSGQTSPALCFQALHTPCFHDFCCCQPTTHETESQVMCILSPSAFVLSSETPIKNGTLRLHVLLLPPHVFMPRHTCNAHGKVGFGPTSP